MLLYVNLENFRGLSRRFDFMDPASGSASPRVKLHGRNGSKKTTVREAISFLFTGRDSMGSQKPTHLISMGEEGCEVEVMTRKGAVITRSLTQKGSGSLRMTIAGERKVLTQSEFEGMLCPADVFLSVFIPGYLLGHLPKNRQSAVLSFILPPVDRVAYMRSFIVGLPLLELDYSKRPDLLQKQIADQRNALSHEISGMRGEEKALKDKLYEGPKRPIPPPELALFDLQEPLQREWLVYESALGHYENDVREFRRRSGENTKIARRREDVEAELKAIILMAPPEQPPVFSNPRPVPPQQPALLHEEERDRCPSCGQTVGSKHREMVRGENENIKAAWQLANNEYRSQLKLWEADRDRYSAALYDYEKRASEIQKANAKLVSRHDELERELRRELVPHALPPEEPLPPKKPSEEFSKVRYLELKKAVEDYYRSLGAFDRWQTTAGAAAARLETIDGQIGSLQGEIELYRRHEEALRQLPAYELTEQKTHLQMPAGYELRVDEGIELFDRTGCPYGLLSRGQRMHADFEMSLKVNALLQRKVGMVFLDDFDLADWSDLLKESSDTVQIFSAHVEAGRELEVRLVK